jgi:hypothetical protein
MAATGGTVSSRALYTDDDLYVHRIHAPLILNGIHSFIAQPDLAQRCLPLRTLAIPANSRKSESAMKEDFERDLPRIFRGVLDLISQVLRHLPGIDTSNSERMIDFSRWLGAMEKVHGVRAGIYQGAYSEVLRQAQLDSLHENQLASALYSFAIDTVKTQWSGTPAELLEKLNYQAAAGSHYSKGWPDNPIALSKRLTGLKASLQNQGINIEFGRGKHRTITILVVDADQ